MWESERRRARTEMVFVEEVRLIFIHLKGKTLAFCVGAEGEAEAWLQSLCARLVAVASAPVCLWILVYVPRISMYAYDVNVSVCLCVPLGWC